MSGNSFESRPVTDARLLAYRDALASLYLNGRVALAAFRAVGSAVGSARRASGMHHPSSAASALAAFLNDTEVRTATAAPAPAQAVEPPAYCLLGPYELEGALAEILMEGGAYRRFEDAIAARRLAIEFVDAVAGDDRMAVRAYFTRAAWSNWFFHGPWDRTIAAVDPATDQWTLLCATDTD